MFFSIGPIDKKFICCSLSYYRTLYYLSYATVVNLESDEFSN